MPDVTKILEQDHRTVEELFAQFEDRGDPRIAEQICDELTVHAAVEEEGVYPWLHEIDPDADHEARREHDEAKALIRQIRAASDSELADLVMQLKAAVEHHVQEEESEIFPEMREKLGDKLDDMAEQVMARKEELTAVVADEPTGTTGTAGRVQGRAEVSDLKELTKDELYERAKAAGIEGRSNMNKAQLVRALSREGT